jgi:tetratricopeptide (TPR) repeat protein
VLLETTPQPARNVDPVLAYYSWGAADPENRVRSVGMGFTAGSIAANLSSFDARTFKQPPDTWQPSVTTDRSTWFEGSSDTLIGDLIREGVTGVSGQVGEAYVLGAVRPDILFPAYVEGFNLAEAFYLAMPTLSWQTVVIGDPLCAPFARPQLTRQGLEEGLDETTGLPGLFSQRRLAVAKAANPDQPEAAVALVVRAETLLAREDSAGARAALEKAVEVAPKAAGLLLLLADLEEKAGAYDDAIERYRRIIEIQPANVIALNNLAYALAVRKSLPAEAHPFARRAANLAPRAGQVLDTLGWVEHLLGNHDVAANVLQDAVRVAPKDAEIRLHAARAFAAAGRLAQAQAELEEALRIDPGLDSREEVTKLRQRLGRQRGPGFPRQAL